MTAGKSSAKDELKSLPMKELWAKLGSSPDGLGQAEAEKRLTQYGPNEIEEKKKNALLKFLGYFWGPIPWMIEAAVVLSAVARHWPGFAIILLLLVTNAVVGFWEEHQASDAIAALKATLAVKARVRRDGKWTTPPARVLVPGDVIRLRLGDIVPADARLLDGDPVQVDQSGLTGESLPATRKPGEAVFSGSIVRRGEIGALVYATGTNTYFGKTAQLVQAAHTVSHFQKAVLKIGNYLIILAVALVAVIITVSLFRRDPILTTLQFALVLTVAAIPVAMPTVLSVTMAVGARLLAKKKAMVTRLAAIEEMAGVDVLCADKTGTLTQNKLTLGDPFSVEGASAEQVILSAALASRMDDKDTIDMAVIGGLKDHEALKSYHVVHFQPFDPVHKRTQATVKGADGKEFKVTKGAPQVILELSKDAGKVKAAIEKAVDAFAAQGFRSLGVARAEGEGSWQFLGVLPLFDPPREDAKATIATARQMGVKIKMVTGDALAIARETAEKLGLGTNILDASGFGDAKHHETARLSESIESADGFAQVFPEHKFHIIDVLQQRGHIVGMTGDGVNDAPALKKADCGIAVSGAQDAARAAAAIVLMAPGLSVIIDAIKESRKIFQRMNSYAIYRIAETLRVLVFMTLAILIFNFYPLTAVMIVMLALLNDGAILSIAYDNVHFSDEPEAWNMRRVLGIATVLGTIGPLAAFGLFYLGDRLLHLDRPRLQTLMYLMLSVAGHLTIFLSRTRGPFWSRRPALVLVLAVGGTQTFATLISVYGLFVAAIGWEYALLVWGYALVWAFLSDCAKLLAYRVLDHRQAEPKPEAKAEPKPEAKAEPRREITTPVEVTPQLVERVHRVYEELGCEDVRAVADWEKAERDVRKDERPRTTPLTRPSDLTPQIAERAPTPAEHREEKTTMRLDDVTKLGQSIWLDSIRRHLLTGGELSRLVTQEGVRGVTSNPSIFRDAIAGSTDYDAELEGRVRAGHASAVELYTDLVVEDIRGAADVLRPVYDTSARRDGYVSLEVSPALAHDTAGTIARARALWQRVARDNLMIKVPATPEGIAALPALLAEGVNVNVTLLFARGTYRRVAEAYLAGLEAFGAKGGALDRLASVASIFVSRLDVLVDRTIEERANRVRGPEKAALEELVGRVAIANAKLLYQDYLEMLRGPRFQALAARGAGPQRVLWASTSTKDPRRSDVLYVEALMGPGTVDTVPPATLHALLDHGRARASLEEDVDGARRVLDALARAGISLDACTDELLEEGVAGFQKAFDELMDAIEQRRAGTLGSALDRTRRRLPPDLEATVSATLEDWRASGKVRRLWAGDATLWTGHDESRWLGWLGVAERQIASVARLRAFAYEVERRAFTRVALLGMGGSSLCADVLSRTFPKGPGFPALAVLDSTDPAQIEAFAADLDLARTLFIVSSKSGTTLEPNLFDAYFHDLVRRRLGEAEASARFAVVTDPGSPLAHLAEARGYAHVFYGVPEIGGRYSALSNFGLVPAAAMGLDVERFLSRAEVMVQACASCVPPSENPGVMLGVVLGTAAKAGRDKVTLVASPPIAALGAWLEQLLAESTGKHGTGLIPVDREPLGPPDVYGEDRLFVYLRLDRGADPAEDLAVAALEQAGHPVLRIALADAYDLGQEFFRWEIAVAVASSILGIDAFDQPDVEASKIEARRLTEQFERTGKLPAEAPFFQGGGLSLYADAANREVLERAAGLDRTLTGYLRAHFARLSPGDYCALLAWIERTGPHQSRLDDLRRAIRDRRHVATCVGFGPRFLHSTGQAYKGGPASGEFLQITTDEPCDLTVPGHDYTFGVVMAAQARGDFEVLAKHGRRLLRVHLGGDVDRGLDALVRTTREALAA
jgi:H+-transporting ATPase